MADTVVLLATLVAIVLGIAGFVTLTMEMHVVSGTFFMFTAFAIYVRERRS